MKGIAFGGFIFVGGCILLGAHSISCAINSSAVGYSEALAYIFVIVGGFTGVLSIYSHLTRREKDNTIGTGE